MSRTFIRWNCTGDLLPVTTGVANLKRPTLTIALRSKWYRLHVVTRGADVATMDFGVLDRVSVRHGLTPYVDHVPNPLVVCLLAHEHDWDVDELALEIMLGRWSIEGEGTDDEFAGRCLAALDGEWTP